MAIVALVETRVLASMEAEKTWGVWGGTGVAVWDNVSDRLVWELAPKGMRRPGGQGLV